MFTYVDIEITKHENVRNVKDSESELSYVMNLPRGEQMTTMRNQGDNIKGCYLEDYLKQESLELLMRSRERQKLQEPANTGVKNLSINKLNPAQK